MRPDADLSLHGQADLLAEFIERLDLHDVILAAVDWGGPQLTAVRHPERIAALVLLSEEAFDNIPPGLPGTLARESMATGCPRYALARIAAQCRDGARANQPSPFGDQ